MFHPSQPLYGARRIYSWVSLQVCNVQGSMSFVDDRRMLPSCAENPLETGLVSYKSSVGRILEWEATRTLGKRRLRHSVFFDLNGRVPVKENVFSVLVLNAPGQMIMKADTDLCTIKGLCWSETARNCGSCRPFLALQPPDCVNCSLNDSGVLN